MLDTLKHRGPDSHGVANLQGATLLHARLAILDLSETGRQPLASSKGRVWAVVNGEIYNHHELRMKLIDAGYRFRGSSDAEVVPALYHHFGRDFMRHIRGMFALAVFDEERKRLLLGRDRFGIKPLFYSTGTTDVFFASELNALRRFPSVSRGTDAQAVHDFLALGFVPPPLTVFTGVRALEPGTTLEADLGGSRLTFCVRRYHQWAIEIDSDLQLADAADTAERLLDQAVARQLESDVPLGALLSGGIDSSLIAAAAQTSSPSPLDTFNVRFDEPGYDETRAAVAVAEHLGTRHHTLDFDSALLTWGDATKTLQAVGQPYGDKSLLAATPICKLMRSLVTVGLSGDGGDEAFGGYDTFNNIRYLRPLSTIPTSLRRPLLYVLSTAARSAPRGRRPSVATRLSELGTAQDPSTMLSSLLTWICGDELGRMWTGGPVEPVARLFQPEWKHDLPRRATHLERLSALATEVTVRLRLAGDYLVKVDTASMVNGLEMRVPFLDEDLFAFGMRLPHRLKANAAQRKVVLRTLGRRRLPPSVAELPKHGFGTPIRRAEEFATMAIDALSGPSTGLLDAVDCAHRKAIVNAFSQAKPLHGVSQEGLETRLMMLLSLALTPA